MNEVHSDSKRASSLQYRRLPGILQSQVEGIQYCQSAGWTVKLLEQTFKIDFQFFIIGDFKFKFNFQMKTNIRDSAAHGCDITVLNEACGSEDPKTSVTLVILEHVSSQNRC